MTRRQVRNSPLPWMAHGENFQDHERTNRMTSQKLHTDKATSVTLGDLIAMHIEGIMADRTKMRAFELDIDEWVKKQEDRTQVKRNEVLGQLKTAQNVLESIYSRLAQSY